MPIFAPFDCHLLDNRVNLSWLWHSPDDLCWRLRRLLGCKVRVRAACAVTCGRLVAIARDHIVLRRRGRSVLIRLAAVSWIRPQRPARKTRPRRRIRTKRRRLC